MVMFGIETFGTFAKEGKDFIEVCTRLAVAHDNNYYYSVVLCHMIQRISIALQIANFKAMAKLVNINHSNISDLSSRLISIS
jgi:hypothetical protein